MRARKFQILFAASSLLVVNLVQGFAGGGFAASSRPSRSKQKEGNNIVQLNKEAKKLLKKHGNNVELASSEYFQAQMNEILPNIEKGGVTDLHQAKVAATWDTIALFLPQDYIRSKGKVEERVARRLRHIITACRGPDNNCKSLLDVGCGDGALVPFLPDSCEYSGCDISREMISLGQKQHPRSNFWVGSFPESVPSGSTYNAVLFNGSLQFFKDTAATIQEASKFVKPGGRLILSHVNGGKFVKEECQKNPSVAVRNMPNTISLVTMRDTTGLCLLDKAEVFEGVDDFDPMIDGNDEEFYLAVLEKVIDTGGEPDS